MRIRTITFGILSCCMMGCSSAATEVSTVAHVDLDRYLGRWYEISSYPQWFEKGLSDVSALYLKKEGYVEVINSGYKEGKLKQAKGRAKTVVGWGNARLKVSFFRPFYAKYWIVALDPNYTWAVVSNPKRSTLWVLSRTPRMEEACYQSILTQLNSQGYDTNKLVMMKINR